MLSVCDGVTDDVLEEDLEDTTGLLVDETGDTLHTTTTRETTDGGLGDTYKECVSTITMVCETDESPCQCHAEGVP